MIQYIIGIDFQSAKTLYLDTVLTTGDVLAYEFIFPFYSQGIFFNGKGYDLVVKAKGADGRIITDTGEITEEGKGRYVLSSNMYAVPGTLILEVALVSPLGGYVTAKELVLQVREGLGESNLTAQDKAPIVAKILEKSARAETVANQALYDLGGLSFSLNNDGILVITKED